MENSRYKFRAWDNDDLFIRDWETLCKGVVYYHEGDTIFNDTDFELMQFTGLLDKNGKEIYESDIVRYTHPHLDHPRDFEIVFHEGAFVQREINPKGYVAKDFENDLWIDWEDLEVIGNKFENPELCEPPKGE